MAKSTRKNTGDIMRIVAAAQPRPGRKPRAPEIGTPVMMRLQAGMLEMLDRWRLEQLDEPSRPEAARRLLKPVLESIEKARRR
jgi:hypothetical protein